MGHCWNKIPTLLLPLMGRDNNMMLEWLDTERRLNPDVDRKGFGSGRRLEGLEGGWIKMLLMEGTLDPGVDWKMCWIRALIGRDVGSGRC